MKKINLLLIGLLVSLTIYSQNSVVTKSHSKDSEQIETEKTYPDVDLLIDKAKNELNSLYKNYQFSNPKFKKDLMGKTKKIKKYISKLIDDNAFKTKSDKMSIDDMYKYDFKNSNLNAELETYINAIHDLDINKTVKKVATDKLEKISDENIVKDYTAKYNAPITILKIQLYNIIWSEIYMIDNENVPK